MSKGKLLLLIFLFSCTQKVYVWKDHSIYREMKIYKHGFVSKMITERKFKRLKNKSRNWLSSSSINMEQVLNGESFSIISIQDRPSGSVAEKGIQPYSVKRTSDGEVFTIGDFVSNGARMKGTITGFTILEGEIYVDHTWSGVGMNLNSLHRIITLPSQHQIGDTVWFDLWSSKVGGEVNAVHFYEGKVKYDLKVFGGNGEETRIYNIDSCYCVKKIA